MLKRKRRARRVRNAEGPPKILALLAACPLYPQPAEGRCGACGKELVGKRTRWCSTTCARSWRTNHLWTYARRAARTRDKNKCRSCGVQGAPKPSRRLAPAAYAKARATYDAVKLEVNHLVAVYTIGADRTKASCCNHLLNLETLCAACHAPITAAQAAARAAARRARKAELAVAA